MIIDEGDISMNFGFWMDFLTLIVVLTIFVWIAMIVKISDS